MKQTLATHGKQINIYDRQVQLYCIDIDDKLDFIYS